MTTPPSFVLFPHLLDDIEIPVDGTLSRVLFKGDGIRVVVFAFDEGQELTDHTAAVPAILQVVEGRLDLTLGEESVEVAADSWVYMEANLNHAIVALEPSVMLLTLQRGA
ncbi:MAG: cupin domain-containing protein [Acidimicrobiia bacterium]